MSKTRACSHEDPKPIQMDISANTQKEKTNDLIETAAEQLAILLWKTWLHKKNTKGKR